MKFKRTARKVGMVCFCLTFNTLFLTLTNELSDSGEETEYEQACFRKDIKRQIHTN
jgi:hypothetical protein